MGIFHGPFQEKMDMDSNSGLISCKFGLTISIDYCPRAEIANNQPKRCPIVNAKVRQIWNQYALKIRGEKDYESDLNGEVILPRRVITTNILSLTSGAIKNISETGLHSSFTSYESIGIFADGFKDTWFYSATVEGTKELDGGVVILKKAE